MWRMGTYSALMPRAQHVTAVTGDIERHATVVPLGERYVRRLHGARVLQASELQRQQLRW